MPDSRSHRGAHPEDARDFAQDAWPALLAAVRELSFLFQHAYAPDAALKLVGDHHQLTARQRKAVLRGAAAQSSREARRGRRRTMEQLRGQPLMVDGFNCLITVEAMLSGAPVFRGQDGALRDLASVHGTYRSVEESERALDLMLSVLEAHQLGTCTILLDRPVGNSGRTRALIEERAARTRQLVRVELSDQVDRQLAASTVTVASSDSWILDRAPHWLDLPGAVAQHAQLALWLVDLSS